MPSLAEIATLMQQQLGPLQAQIATINTNNATMLKQMETLHSNGEDFPAHFIFVGPDEDGLLEDNSCAFIEHVPYPDEKITDNNGKILLQRASW